MSRALGFFFGIAMFASLHVFGGFSPLESIGIVAMTAGMFILLAGLICSLITGYPNP